MKETERLEYLIIGNSAGGIGAAEAIRGAGHAGSLAVISEEPYPAYSRPLISEYLAEHRPLESMLFRPGDFYERNRIDIHLGIKVTGIDTDARTVELDDGRTLAWGKLLLATGGSPVVPGIHGAGLKGVFNFTTLDDAMALDRYLDRYRRRTRAVVIGGGLIGMSVTEALVKRGVEVTVVEMKERILNTVLDEEASALVENTLNGCGVEIITGRTVSGVSSYLPGEATGVVLDDDRPIPCEVVIVAIGVQPRTGIASGTGVDVNRGIVVNRHMETSVPGVYACGDAAEAYDFIHRENRVTPIWPNAYAGGRVAGRNMAGVDTEYAGSTTMNSLHYFGLAIASAGLSTPPDEGYTVLSRNRDRYRRKVILKDGLVVGMVFSGDIERSGIIYSLMKDRVDVDGFAEALVADDFGLVSLPEEIWRSRLEAPRKAVAL